MAPLNIFGADVCFPLGQGGMDIMNSKFQMFVDFETLLGTNMERARVIAGTVSLIWSVLDEVHDTWQHAKTNEEKHLKRIEFTSHASKLMPVLEMLDDYVKNNHSHAEQTYYLYEGSCRENAHIGPRA